MAKLHSEDLERNINKYIYRLRGGYNIKAMQWHVLGVFSWNSGHLKEKQNHTQLNKLIICTWTNKKSLGFMHPQNLTAISLAWAGHATLHSGTGPSRPCQTPCITSTVFFSCQKPDKLPPQQTAAEQWYNLIGALLQLIFLQYSQCNAQGCF